MINLPLLWWFSGIGLAGFYWAILSWLFFVLRPYALRLRRARGDNSHIVLLEIETTLRRARDDGDVEARRLLLILRRLAQCAGFCAACFAILLVAMC